MLHSRMERIQKLIQQELATIIDRDLKNPELPDFITVSHVKVSNDLSEATVLVTLLEDHSEQTVRKTVDELNRSAGFIRKLLSRRVHLKRHPHLKFRYTDATRHAAEMEELLRRIRDEREQSSENESSPNDEDRDR